MRAIGNVFLLVVGCIYGVGITASILVLAISAVLVSGLEIPCLGIREPERAATEVVERQIAARESEARDRCEMTGGTALRCAAAVALHRDRPVFAVRVRESDGSGFDNSSDFVVTTARGARYAVRESIFQRGPCSGMRIHSSNERA